MMESGRREFNKQRGGLGALADDCLWLFVVGLWLGFGCLGYRDAMLAEKGTASGIHR
jgi:hypothetical protein